MDKKFSIGLAVITFNEEANIEKCIKSVPFSVDTVVVDSNSTDKTREIAKNAGARVFQRDWPGYAKQKQYALEQVNADWVLVMDADEYLLPAIQQEILEIIQSSKPHNAYRIYGHNFFMGKILSHGKAIDNSIRLVQKSKVRWNDRAVHEDLIVENDDISQCQNPQVHISSPTIMSRIKKSFHYAQIETQHYEKGTLTFDMLFIYPIRYFLSYFFKKQGWRDGFRGFIWTFLLSFQIFYFYYSCLKKELFNK